ncbi:MAG: efflux RND transporter periplasmic adaptor subunit [Candidatus Competibacteraceae bacterium]
MDNTINRTTALLLFVLFTSAGHAQSKAWPFPIATAETRELAREHILEGVIEAVDRSTVSAQTSGRVQEILFDVNDVVPAGAPIIRLRDTDQRASLARAEAGLREAQARRDEAQSEYQRIKGIFSRKLVSKADMDAATAALDAAQARLEAAQAEVTGAREELDNTVVKAPYGGVVLERHVSLGESVQPGQPLMSGFSLKRLRVVATVPQRLLETIRQYSEARVLLDDQRSIAAEQLTFFPYADPASHVFKVRVDLPANIKGLYPGMSVKTAFVAGRVERLLTPRKAVVQRGEVSGIYVLHDDRVSLRQIRPGKSVDTDWLEVLAGLEAGEQVALDPIAAGIYLKEQQPRR